MSSPIIIIRNNIAKGATVNDSEDHGIFVVNPDGHIVATGFPTYDHAYGWLAAAEHFCHKE